AMNHALRRHTQTGVRGRLVTRPQLEQLERRLAAGSVLDLFGMTLAGPSLFGPSGESPAGELVAADSAADRQHAAAPPSRVPPTSLPPTPTAPQNSDTSRMPSTTVSPIPPQESAFVLGPRWGGIQDSLEAAWDRMGTFDGLLRDTFPTEPVAAGLGSAVSGGG